MDEPSASPGAQAPEESRLSREQRHAFKNIFSIIIANAEMIDEDLPAAEPVRRRLERIVAASRRGEQLVQQICNLTTPPAHDEASPAAPASPLAAPPGRVLVIDDEPDVVEIIRRYLEKEGLSVQGCTDSREALERLQRNPFQFDLVISDFDMPHLSGVALCERARGLRPDLPVIMVTGHDHRGSGEQFADVEVRALLLKPLDRKDLLNMVRRFLPA